jgi:hypothetical protein
MIELRYSASIVIAGDPGAYFKVCKTESNPPRTIIVSYCVWAKFDCMSTALSVHDAISTQGLSLRYC